MKHSIWNCKFYIHASIKDIPCLFPVFFLFFKLRDRSWIRVETWKIDTNFFIETQSLNKFLDFLFY